MNLAGLIGADAGVVRDRLGPPDASSEAGGESWLVYREAGATVRVRCVPPDLRVASWTVSWEEPRPTLRRAVEPLGLWPTCAPDVEAGAAEGLMVRRALPGPGDDASHSLTAGVRSGGFVRVAAFDEPPEW